MTTLIREEILETTEDKIVTAFIREFLMNNPLAVPYEITKENLNVAMEKLKVITNGFPKEIDILKIK
ncbi:hypothetical protein [Flavobacterium sp. CAN_S2]|uniref:hypothetical protein n=1 Tax=Flavobacterium sp. CAN_S2 TaxID=2787726 RepID=UPI0018CA4950